MFKTKSSMIVVSLLVAVAIWLYVMGEVDPETRTKISDIPVHFTNTEELANHGMAVACDEQITINATVSGKRSDVNAAKKNGLTASVDVSDCVHGENNKKITINLPDGLNVENMSETIMTVVAEDIAYRYKPVEIEFSGADTSSETVIENVPWVMSCSPETISVSGAESSIDKINRVIGVVASEEAVSEEDKTVNVKLIPVNKKGREIMNVDLYQKEAEAVIRLLAVSAADLVLTSADTGKTIDISKLDIDEDLNERIRIAGQKEVIEKIKTVKGVVTLDGDKVYIDTDLPEDVFIMIGEDNGKIIWN